MNFEQQVLNKLDTIIELLSRKHEQSENDVQDSLLKTTPKISVKLDEYVHNDNKRKHNHLLNKSKFLDEKQRDALFKFIDDSNIAAELAKYHAHKRPTIFQVLIEDKLHIKLSYYMAKKLINLIQSKRNDEFPRAQAKQEVINECKTVEILPELEEVEE